MARKQTPDTVRVEVPGGRGTITMRPLTSKEYIAIRRGEVDDVGLLEMTASAVVEYLPGQDPLDLPPVDLAELASNWIEAIGERAVPPATA